MTASALGLTGFTVDEATFSRNLYQPASAVLCDEDVIAEFSISLTHLQPNDAVSVTVTAQPRFDLIDRCDGDAPLAPRLCYDTRQNEDLHGLLGPDGTYVCMDEFLASDALAGFPEPFGFQVPDVDMPLRTNDIVDFSFGVSSRSIGCPFGFPAEFCGVSDRRICHINECFTVEEAAFAVTTNLEGISSAEFTPEVQSQFVGAVAETLEVAEEDVTVVSVTDSPAKEGAVIVDYRVVMMRMTAYKLEEANSPMGHMFVDLFNARLNETQVGAVVSGAATTAAEIPEPSTPSGGMDPTLVGAMAGVVAAVVIVGAAARRRSNNRPAVATIGQAPGRIFVPRTTSVVGGIFDRTSSIIGARRGSVASRTGSVVDPAKAVAVATPYGGSFVSPIDRVRDFSPQSSANSADEPYPVAPLFDIDDVDLDSEIPATMQKHFSNRPAPARFNTSSTGDNWRIPNLDD